MKFKSVKKIFIYFFVCSSIFCIYKKFGQSAFYKTLPNKFELTWIVTPMSLIPLVDHDELNRDESIFMNFLALYQAANDKRVTQLNIVFNNKFSNMLCWHVQELIKIIEMFKNNGKKVVIFADSIEELADFVLYSSANQCYLSPGSVVWLHGFQLNGIFEGNRNDKKKLDPWGVQYGDFKGGVSGYIGTEFDLYVATNRRAFLMDLTQQAKLLLSCFLNKPKYEIDQYIKNNYCSAEEAKTLGLITDIKIYKPNKNEIFLKDYRKKFENLINFTEKNVCVISIDFPLFDEMCDFMTDELNILAKNNAIKYIMLLIHCPGGTSNKIDELDNAIANLKKHGKYVIAVVSMAFSGGCQIATQADKIFALPASFIGSIGTYIIFSQDYAKLAKKGYSIDYIGTYDIHEIDRLDEKTKKFIIKHILLLGNKFANLIGKRRKIPDNVLKNLALGQIYTANSAFGLIDDLSGLLGALDHLYELNNKKSLGFIFLPNERMLRKLWLLHKIKKMENKTTRPKNFVKKIEDDKKENIISNNFSIQSIF